MSGKFALIIGNSEYMDPALAKLTAPGRDAEDFGRILKDKEICAFDQVNILVNQLSSTVLEAIDEFFDQKKPDDLLVFYFSGHGIRDELGSLYLAFQNTIRSRLRSTAVKSEYIREAMEQSRSKRQVVILDCCNSGAFPQGTKAEVGGMMGMVSALQGYGRFVLTASDATQFAWEGDQVMGETDNSLFTHFLVKGLAGEADTDGDGQISVDELYDYAYEQISRVTPKQTPTKSSSKQEGEIILRKITRLEDIKPVALPDQLISETENPYPEVRLRAVEQLAKLLTGKNLGLARSARDALERMAAADDSRRVAETATDALASVRQEEPSGGQKAEADQSVSSSPTIPLRDEQAGLAEPVKTEPTKPLEEKAEPLPLLAQPMVDKSRLQRIGMLGAALLAIVLVGFAIRRFQPSVPGPLPTEPPTAIQAPTDDVAAATEVPIVLPEATEASATPTSEPPIDTETPTESSPSTATPYSTEFTDSKGVLMVLVPAGDFQMGYRKGDPDEKQVHTVDLPAYYIDKYEVTNALYRACEKAGGCKPPIKTGSATHNNYYGISGFVEYPVVHVDWNMANDYCGWRGARLPTEAEWEKAARGNLDDPPLYPWGDKLSCETANYNDGHGGCNHDTQRVGTYESGKSLYGVYDMAGNVWEWVADRYSEAYYGTPFPSNPQGPESGQSRVLRGGAWNSGENDLRASNRRKYAPTYANFDTGFRCAVGISP